MDKLWVGYEQFEKSQASSYSQHQWGLAQASSRSSCWGLLSMGTRLSVEVADWLGNCTWLTPQALQKPMMCGFPFEEALLTRVGPRVVSSRPPLAVVRRRGGKFLSAEPPSAGEPSPGGQVHVRAHASLCERQGRLQGAERGGSGGKGCWHGLVLQAPHPLESILERGCLQNGHSAKQGGCPSSF